MAELGRLGLQVAAVERIAVDDQRDPFGNRDAVLLDRVDLARIIGHQPQADDAELFQHRLAMAVAALVGLEAEFMIGLHRVGAGILQPVGADLVDQADAAPFLAHVKHDAAPFRGDAAQRALELGAAVAALAEQRVAGQALGVDAAQHRPAVRDIAQRQRQMLLAALGFHERMQREGSPRHRQFAGSHVFQRVRPGYGRDGFWLELHGALLDESH